MTKRTKQILLMIAVVFIAILAGGVLYVNNWLKKSIAPTSGTIAMQGIDNSVEITFDSMGIAQIWAETEYDGYFALGYMHASDRLFQMDMARRWSQGRMSELLGDVTLDTDKLQRKIGHNRIAKDALLQLTEESKKRLQAYADGINSYKRTAGSPPFEYLLLGGEFEDWTVYDCLTLLSFQTWYSDALQNHDRFFREVIEKIGPNKTASFCIDYPNWAPVTIPESNKIGIHNSQNWFFEQSSPNPYLMSYSSNAWVIGSSKSASGKAMLSSDPHLHISQLPQFWYMVGLHIKETSLNVLGITTPGLPFVIMGHNGQAAWAFTAGGIQVTKNYEEKINPEDSTKYQTGSGWESFDYIVDSIFISGESEPIIHTTKMTRHGPIISESENSSTVISMHWAGFDIDLNLACKSGFDLQYVSSFEDFNNVVTSLGALNAHWMYADIDDNIGYQLGTPIFYPQIDNSCLLIPGSSDKTGWQEYYTRAKSPHSKNPPQGWLASCNNLPTRSKQYPKLTGTFKVDRITRISEILRNRDSIDIDFLKKIQQDKVDTYLRKWRTEIARHLEAIGEKQLAEQMANWNGQSELNSKETPIAVIFLDELNRMTFEDELGEAHRGVRTLWLENIYHDTSLHFWFDIDTTEQIETRDLIAMKAIRKTLDLVGNKKWGDINSLTMQHPMATVPIIGGILELSKETYRQAGTDGTLNASFFVRENDTTFQTIVGPSWRFLIDFADVDGAQFVLPAGNSGNPMSPHFYDFNRMWRDGDYWNVPISEQLVKGKAVSTLNLLPQRAQQDH